MANKLGVINDLWDHAAEDFIELITSNRVATKKLIASKYSLRCQLGGGLKWYGPVAIFYDSSDEGLGYELATLETHYNNSSDACDDGDGKRGGTIIESTCRGKRDWKYNLLNPDTMALLEKDSYDTPSGIPVFGTYSVISTSSYGKIGYMLMQPLARSNQSSIDPRMPDASTNTYAPDAFFDPNPYASHYFRIDLMLLCDLALHFTGTAQSGDGRGSVL